MRESLVSIYKKVSVKFNWSSRSTRASQSPNKVEKQPKSTLYVFPLVGELQKAYHQTLHAEHVAGENTYPEEFIGCCSDFIL
ncbi:MAG: hypothetical protein IJ834_05010 [Paludibacteraceae bacterium]|nr:hypothetical protein [Paludibacteraceae bacterium]